MTVTSEFVSDVLGFTGDRRVTGLEFDAVTPLVERVGPRSLFIALTDHQDDSHALLPDVLRSGPAAIVVEPQLVPATVRDAPVVRFDVPCTWAAFMQLARAWRPRLTMPLIAVIGSVGKTTTKEFLGAVLTPRFPRVHRTEASQNGVFGVPRTVLEARPGEHDAVVVEIGIDAPGAMESHIRTVSPDALVVTCLGPEHLDRLLTPETAIAEECVAIGDVAMRGGLCVLDLGDSTVARIARGLPPASVLGYELTLPGTSRLAGAEALHAVFDERDDTLQFPALGGAMLPVPLPGIHNARNLLAAVTLARAYGAELPAIVASLDGFRGAPNRSALETIDGVTVLRDFYNANPTSMRAALELVPLLARRSHARRTIACLADMLDLGAYDAQFHAEIMALLARLPFGAVFTYGECMNAAAAELPGLGFRGTVRSFADAEGLGVALRDFLRSGDFLLMKASAAMNMSAVWDIVAGGAVAAGSGGA